MLHMRFYPRHLHLFRAISPGLASHVRYDRFRDVGSLQLLVVLRLPVTRVSARCTCKLAMDLLMRHKKNRRA